MANAKPTTFRPAPKKGPDYIRILMMIALLALGIAIVWWLYEVGGPEKQLQCSGSHSLNSFGSCVEVGG